MKVTAETPVRTISRRGLLKAGLIGASVLAVAAAIPALLPTRRGRPPRRTLELLTPDEYAVLAAAVAVLVPGPGAGPAWPAAADLDVAGTVDAAMALQHPAVGREFRQLLQLLENGLVGLVTTGVPKPFTRCSAAQQVRRLDAWRRSRFALFRTGYTALRRLAEATYHASPRTFALVGYPGPPSV